MKYLLLISILFSQGVLALDIDEKLTIRLLRLSRSKKTALVNRGLEDGLVTGDHAKFYLTSGVIARGVVVKASPSRSVWSIYRFVNPAELIPDRVMGVKIATPVKLTEDKTKAFTGYQYSSLREDLSIPLKKSQEDLNSHLSEDERRDLMQLGGSPPPPVYSKETLGVDARRTLEVWGIMHFTSFSTSISGGSEESTTNTGGKNTAIDFSLGIEKYFAERSGFLADLSFFGIIHKITTALASSASSSSFDSLEYGVGVNWHFLAHPLSYGKLIGHLQGSGGVGSVTDSFTSPSSDGSEESSSDTIKGESNFLSLGVGFKYYLRNGFGGRFLLDYYRRAEAYKVTIENESTKETEEVEISKTIAGPRMMFGLSYRW